MSGAELESAILDSMPIAVTSVAPDGTILFLNDAAARNLSGTRTSLVGTSLYDYFPDRAATTRERIRQAVTQRAVQHFESLVTLPDGRERYFDSMYCPAIDDGGEVFAVQIVAHDVTNARAAAEPDQSRDDLWGVVSDDLSMTAERVQAILETAPLVVTVHDPDTTVRYLNRLVEDVGIENILGQPALSWLTEETQPAMRAAFAEVMQKRQVTECEVMGISGRTWLVRLAPLVHEGRVEQILGCTLDITEPKRLQAQLAQKQTIESLGTMARGIAHDFNNLLTMIMGNTGLARRRLASRGDATTPLDEVDAAARRAADLCAQMLVYAKQDQPLAEPCDLNVVIQEMAPLTRAAVNAKILVTHVFADAALPTQCNRAQLGQIVANLVNNAADAIGDEHGDIQITTESITLTERTGDWLPERPPPGRYARLQVTDTGPGIDAHARDRIFDPFYSTKTTGHGLGLSVVLGILSSQGAAIAVDTLETGGTTMTVVFPLHDRPVPDTPEPTRTIWTTGEGTVLIVDDEDAIRRAAAAVLAEAGYDVLQAEDGNAALTLLADHGACVRAVILDVTMPGRDGHSTLQEIRARRRELPVLLSSGKPIELAGDDPFVRYLPKPYDPAAFLQAIAEAVRGVPNVGRA